MAPLELHLAVSALLDVPLASGRWLAEARPGRLHRAAAGDGVGQADVVHGVPAGGRTGRSLRYAGTQLPRLVWMRTRAHTATAARAPNRVVLR